MSAGTALRMTIFTGFETILSRRAVQGGGGWTRDDPVPVPGLSSAADSVINEEDDYGASHGDQETVEIHAGYTGQAQESGEPSADDGADDAQNDVHDEALAPFINQLASDETGDQTEHDPGENRHLEPLL